MVLDGEKARGAGVVAVMWVVVNYKLLLLITLLSCPFPPRTTAGTSNY